MRTVLTTFLILSGLISSADISACDTVVVDDTYQIIDSGSYCLAADRGIPLSIVGGDVELDCQGHTITDDSGTQFAGVYIDSMAGVTVRNCQINNFQIGIYLRSGDHSQLVNNTISKSRIAAISVYARDAKLIGNRIINYDNPYAAWQENIQLYLADRAVVMNNVIAGSHGSSVVGLLLDGSADVQVVGNQFLDFTTSEPYRNVAVEVRHSQRPKFIHNTMMMRTADAQGLIGITPDVEATCIANLAIGVLHSGFGDCLVAERNTEAP